MNSSCFWDAFCNFCSILLLSLESLTDSASDVALYLKQIESRGSCFVLALWCSSNEKRRFWLKKPGTQKHCRV